MKITKSEKVMSLIDKLYHMDNMQELKTLFLRLVEDILPFESAAFFSVDPCSYKFTNPFLKNLDPASLAKYTNYYEDLDIYKKEVFKDGIPPVDRSSDYINYKEWEKNEHRSDFLLTQNIYNLACIQIIDRQNSLVGEVSFHRTKRQRDFSTEDMKLLKLLQPHLCNVFHLLLRNQQVDLLLKTINDIDWQGNQGIVLLNKDLNIIKCNETANHILNSGLGLNTGKQQLLMYCKRILRENKFLSIRGYSEGQILLDWGIINFKTVGIFDNKRMLLLVITNGIPDNSLQIRLTKFNLTNREAEIVSLALDGKSNKEISTQLFITENTLKTHFKQLYRKIGVRNKQELLLKFLGNKTLL